MGFAEYIVLLGAFFIVPLSYDLFRGRDALKEKIKSKKDLAEIVALSLLVTDIVWILLKIYLMMLELPLSTKY